MNQGAEERTMPTETLQGYQLSPPQRRLWSLLQAPREEGSASPYVARCLVCFEGDLAVAPLRRAVEEVVLRHEILRTRFLCLPGVKTPLQVVADQLPPLVREIDLRARGSQAAGEELERLWRAAALHPHELADGPLLRVWLVRVEESAAHLVLSLPALCADRAALAVLVREIGLAVAGAPGGGEEVLQYPDLAQWQNELLTAEETHAGRQHWRRLDLPPSAALPFRLAGRPGAGFLPAEERRWIAGDRLAALAALGERCGAPLSAVLLGAWQILLWRSTNGASRALALIADGRRYEELEGALGLFARALPLVLEMDGDLPVAEFLARTGERMREAGKWHESFAWDLPPVSDDAAAPGFLPFSYQFDEIPGTPFAVAGLPCRLLRSDDRVDRWEMGLAASLGPEGLELCLTCDAGSYDPVDARRLAAQLEALLDGLRPERALGDLEFLPAEERGLLMAINPRDLPAAGLPVHEAFVSQALRTPDRPALADGERLVTYGELARWSAALARRLRQAGVGPEVRVAVTAERSADTVAALLAVLRAGGAYVPLDPSQPAPRIAAMLGEVGAAVVLGRPELLGQLPRHGARIVPLAGLAELGDDAGAELEDRAVLGEQLAYVLFTSGSSGTPKGVAVEHRQLASYVRSAIAALDLPRDAVYATVSTFAADLGNTMIFPALVSGGCLHVVPMDRTLDPAAWAAYNLRHGIDCLKVVPSHLAALLAGPRPAEALPRRRLVLGGEACSWELVERVRSLAPECRVFNHYGPTETTVGVLIRPLDGEGSRTAGAPPLGRPLAHARVYVVDERLRPVPTLVPGELLVGGAAVARGYLGRPDLTAARFVPDPFGSGGRLYRTGDRVRHLPAGEIEFLGRVDRQLKIRGFRVEPGEVEAQLGLHPAVRQAVVVAREDGPEARLVAYVVAAGEEVPDVPLLRAWLGERLPDFMVPSAFVALDRLPLNANGKVDRAALPAPEPEEELLAGYMAPRNPFEELLAGIWEEVLGRERVGVHDSFFALGGHSILATRVVARLRDAAGVDLPLRRLFEMPTVAGLAAELESLLRSGRGLEEAPIVPVPREGDLPLSFAQRRHWFLHQLEGTSPLYNIRGVVRLEGPLDVAALRRGVAAVLDRHEILRTAFAARAGKPVQVIGAAGGFVAPLLDLAALPAARCEPLVHALVQQQAEQPFDLSRWPLLRLVLLRLGEAEHVLVLTLHHIVADGWSIGLFVRELSALYEAFAAGRPSPLAPLPVQYADFATWENAWLQGPVLHSHLGYWLERLAGAPALLRLPVDRPRPPAQSLRSRRRPIDLDEPLTAGLRALARREGATLFQVLLTAFQALLGWWSGEDDVVVGSPIAGRTRVLTEGLIGCFINALALRTDLSGDPGFIALLARVREAVLGAYTHQDLPFDRLVEELNPERNPAWAPVFQVVFSYANAPRDPVALPGLAVLPLESESTREAKYDLILTVAEVGDRLAGSFTYATDLFDDSTIARLSGHLEALLRKVVERPTVLLSELRSLLAERESEARRQREEELRAERSRRLGAVQRRTIRGA
jgi:amino acid adenylation domain-containing protein